MAQENNNNKNPISVFFHLSRRQSGRFPVGVLDGRGKVHVCVLEHLSECTLLRNSGDGEASSISFKDSGEHCVSSKTLSLCQNYTQTYIDIKLFNRCDTFTKTQAAGTTLQIHGERVLFFSFLFPVFKKRREGTEKSKHTPASHQCRSGRACSPLRRTRVAEQFRNPRSAYQSCPQ